LASTVDICLLVLHMAHVLRPHMSSLINVQAGPGTIAEAMIRGLPMLLFDFIAGQVRLYPVIFAFRIDNHSQ
jgi:hypothetical protein